jgi:5-methylcytosine-specific restriction endonuclease McrA
MKDIEYKALRRDYGLCQECFKKGKIIHADVVSKTDNNKGYELDNLISLCNDCLLRQIKKEIVKQKRVKKNGTINNVQ